MDRSFPQTEATWDMMDDDMAKDWRNHSNRLALIDI